MTSSGRDSGGGSDSPAKHAGVESAQSEAMAPAAHAPSRSTRALGALALGASVAPTLLALAAMTGIGLDQNVPGQLAIVAAFAVVVLPAFGLAAVLGGRAVAYGVSLGAVSLAVVWALPSYFPERRADATEMGLSYLSRGFGDGVQTRAIAFGNSMLAYFEPEPQRLLRANPAADERGDAMAADSGFAALGGDIPNASDGTANTASEGSSTDAPNHAADRSEPRESTWIPYQGDGQTIVIPAHVDGPDFGEELRFVFDTGATLTTIAADVLAILDINIPDDAPEVMLRTAAGEMQARLVLVDAIWLEQEVVEWVTVAVCEHCASDKADGLLGLNVSSHFRVSIDHEAGQLEFAPRHGRRNRRLDIQPWLAMNSVLRRWDDGRLELEVQVENRARRAVKRSVLEVSCSDEQFTIHLDPIPAKQTVTQTASLPWGARCEVFEVVPIAAAWETNRF